MRATRAWVLLAACLGTSGADDEAAGCSAWAAAGECQENPGFVLARCPAECSAAEWAVDPAHDCAAWAAQKECSRNAPFMQIRCANACGMQWLFAPSARRALGLAPDLPNGAPRQAKPALVESRGLSVDAAAALDAKTHALEELMRGRAVDGQPGGDDSGFLEGALASLLYASRLGVRLAGRPALERLDASFRNLAQLAAAGLHYDEDRRDWALRSLRGWVGELRSLANAVLAEPQERFAVAAVSPAFDRGHSYTATLTRSRVEMPLNGLGTCWLSPGESRASVLAAVRMHRKIHVDTAEAYGNEIAIGEALAEARADAEFDPSNVFLATKLSSDAAVGYDGAKKRVADALQNLGVEHLDLFSLHSPFGFQHGEAALERVRGAWRALVELKASGAVRSLGLSNFGTAELRAFCLDPQLGGLELPDVLQNKFDPYRAGTQRPDGEDVEKACKELGILLVAYSTLSGWPFGAAGALSDPFIAQLAARYGAEPAQVLLRWAVDRGHAVIPRSSDAAHVRLNGNALEAVPKLRPDEAALISSLAWLVHHDGSVPPRTTPDSLGILPLFQQAREL